MTTLVYFISCKDRIKIGRSGDVAARMKEISAHLFEELTLIGTARGSASLETAIHKRLRPYRLRDEWFSDCAEVREVIVAVLEQGAGAVKQHYKPINHANSSYQDLSRIQDARQMTTSHPWVSLLARLDDLAVLTNRDNKFPLAVEEINNAKRALIRLHKAAQSQESDEDSLDRAVVLVREAHASVNEICGGYVRPLFTAKKRIHGANPDRPPPPPVSFTRFKYVAGLTAGLI